MMTATEPTTLASDRIANPCSRCGGSGLIEAFAHVMGGQCFRCKGSGVDPKPAYVDPVIATGSFDATAFAMEVRRIATTQSEEDVWNLWDVLDSFRRDADAQGVANVPNIYVSLMESVDTVYGRRFGVKTPDPEPTPDPVEVPTVPTGTYTVEYQDGTHFTFRVQEIKNGSLQGRMKIEHLVGPDNGLDFVAFGFVDAQPGRLKVSVWKKFASGPLGDKGRAAEAALNGDNLEEAGIAYALASSRCRRCNRELTVPASIHRGYGPDCIGKVGM